MSLKNNNKMDHEKRNPDFLDMFLAGVPIQAAVALYREMENDRTAPTNKWWKQVNALARPSLRPQ